MAPACYRAVPTGIKNDPVANRAGRLYNPDMMKKITLALCLGLLAACAPTMSRTTTGDVVVVAHEANGFSAALEHALEVCVERKMNIRHVSTEPGADSGTRTSRFECVKR